MKAKLLINFNLLYCLCSCKELRDWGETFIPDYDSIKHVTEHRDLRRNFLEKKDQEKKMKMIDRTTSTVYVDGITHFKSDHYSQKERAEQFDSEYKNLLSMKEFNYMFMRDENWRTWREIEGANGEKNIISYRCQNNANSSACGFWVIEDTTPCPFEIFSVKDSLKLCGANFSQFTQELGDCPAVIKFGELTAKCNNPIETRWRFSRIYNRDTKRAREGSLLICGGKDFCELTTLYAVTPQHVVFRLVNESNDIIYSRVMKPDRQNFLCVESCGKINLKNMKVTANDAPMSLNLLELNKKKREDVKKRVHSKSKGKPRRKPTVSPAKIKRIVMFQANKMVQHNVALPLKRTTTPMPMLPWLKIRRTHLDFYDDNVLDYHKGDYIIDEKNKTKCIYCNGLLGENYDAKNGTCCYKSLENVADGQIIL